MTGRTPWQRLRMAGLGAGLAVATMPSCVAPVAGPADLPYIAMFNGDGDAIDPSDPGGGYLSAYRRLGTDEHHRRVDAVIDGIERSGLERVLLFIHGGLNEQPDTIGRAIDLRHEIEADGSYPIFINWQSNLNSAYFDHLLFVRQGRDWGWWGVAVTPFVLLRDVVRAVVRFPILLAYQGLEAGTSLGWWRTPDRRAAQRASEHLQADARSQQYGSGAVLRMDEGGDSDEGMDWTTLRYLLALPAKPLSMLVIDAGGTGAWDILRRRVELLFTPDADYKGGTVDREPKNLMLLMDRLYQLQRKRERARARTPGRPGLEITLVCHSTGAIVVNRLLTEAQLLEHAHHDAVGCPVHGCLAGSFGSGLPGYPEARMPRFRNVVYLAAACTIRDYQESAFNYLLHEPDAQVFHVLLHGDDELDEANLWDTVPRGSLLVWIDDFLDDPVAQVERTAGRADNLLPALFATPRTIRGRIHVRVLDQEDPGQPSRHAAFTDPDETDGAFRFWRREAWWNGGGGPPVDP